MNLPFLLTIAAFASAGVLAAWFWPHCARPALLALGAPSVAIRAALVLTIALIASQLVRIVSMVLAIQRTASFWLAVVVSIAYVVVVALGYPHYRLLLRATKTLSRQ